MTGKVDYYKNKYYSEKAEVRFFNKCITCNLQKDNEYLEYIASVLVIYSVVISIISTIKNKILRKDLVIFFSQFLKNIQTIMLYLFDTIQNISTIALNLENEIISNILYWIILILLILLALIITGFAVYFFARFLLNLIDEKWDIIQSIITVIILSVTIYFSDVIDFKKLFNINLISITFIFFLISIIVRLLIKLGLYIKKHNNL